MTGSRSSAAASPLIMIITADTEVTPILQLGPREEEEEEAGEDRLPLVVTHRAGPRSVLGSGRGVWGDQVGTRGDQGAP